MMNSSSPTAAAPPSKRARCALNGTQKVSCLVDGCSSDLGKCREYHRRRRVCEEHTKTPAVFVGGKEKRFCQQCSKFHSLGEFDEGKRSCRKRLDGHNRRRRKPQPGSLFMSSKSFQGTRILQFSIPKIHSSAGVRSRKLSVIGRGQAAVMAADQDQLMDESNRGSQPTETFSWTFSGGRKWFPILPANCPKTGNQVVSEVRLCQPVPDGFVSSEIGKKSHESDENNCALYLLSSHPQLQASGTGLKHLLEPNVIDPVLPVLGADFQVDAADQTPSSISVMAELVDPVSVPNALETDIKYNGMFHMRPDGLLEITSSATFGYFG